MSLLSWLKSRTPWQLLWIFALVNLVNNLDRGIIPGAFENISAFISESTGSDQTNALLGVLQSCFIVGFSVASVWFGHLVHRFPPFKLMTAGLIVWVASCFLCGLSPGYYSLAVGRVLSGVGEASFQSVVPPFIDSNAPHEQRGKWLAVFYLASPLGTALGYAWGGVLGSSVLTWRAAFLLEAFPVVIFLPLLWVTPYHRHHKGGVPDGNSTGLPPAESEHHPLIATEAEQGKATPGATIGPAEVAATSDDHSSPLVQQNPIHKQPSFWSELRAMVTNILYLLLVFGNCGWMAVVMGLGAFGPTFTQGLGMYSTQSQASVALGACIAGAAIIGTPIGGWLLDWEVKRRWAILRRRQPPPPPSPVAGAEAVDTVEPDAGDEATSPAMLDLKLRVTLRQNFFMTMAGSCVLAICVLVAQAGVAPFMICLFLGFTLLLSATTTSGLATMASVPPASRSFAIGLQVLVMHALGDVPSPPIIGYLADSLSPQTCHTSDTSNERVCTRSAAGLQTTLVLVVIWLVWPCVLWCAAWLLVERRHARKRGASSSAQAESGTFAEEYRMPPLPVPKATPSDSGGVLQP